MVLVAMPNDIHLGLNSNATNCLGMYLLICILDRHFDYMFGILLAIRIKVHLWQCQNCVGVDEIGVPSKEDGK